jgi:hypothetical protein
MTDENCVKQGKSDMGVELTIMHDEKRKSYHGDSMGILRRNEPLASFDGPSYSYNITSDQAENAGRRQLRLQKSPSQRLSMDTKVILKGFISYTKSACRGLQCSR